MLDLKYYSYKLPLPLQKPFSELVKCLNFYGRFRAWLIGVFLGFFIMALPFFVISSYNPRVAIDFAMWTTILFTVFFLISSFLHIELSLYFKDRAKSLIASISNIYSQADENTYYPQKRWFIIVRRLTRKFLPNSQLYSLDITSIKGFEKLPINLKRQLKLFCLTGFQSIFVFYVSMGLMLAQIFRINSLNLTITQVFILIVVAIMLFISLLLYKKAKKDFYSNAQELINLINLHEQN